MAPLKGGGGGMSFTFGLFFTDNYFDDCQVREEAAPANIAIKPELTF